MSSRVSRHAPLPNECLFTPIHSRLDPSIFVTNRPISKKYSKMLRARNYIFSQCITIHTIQSQAIDNLTTVNPIPDSEAALSCAPARSFGAWYSFAGLVPQHTKENKKPDIRVPLLMNLDGWRTWGRMGSLIGFVRYRRKARILSLCSGSSVSAPPSSVGMVGLEG